MLEQPPFVERTAARRAERETIRFRKVFTGMLIPADSALGPAALENEGEDPWYKQPYRVGFIDSPLGLSQVNLLASCRVIYSQFDLAIHQNDHQGRRRFVEWAQNETAVVPDFHKRILFSDEAHFWLNGYINKQNCRIWSETNPKVYVETPLHPEKLTVWCALWAGGILLQKR
ncbi:putative DD41D transposase [Trichonephila clavipes]|nr:putative DD41D transposase [Trichonephila clavipes]